MSKILVLHSWQEKGSQDKIVPKFPFSFFVVCTVHGLNLLLEDIVTAELLIMLLYEMI